jgi:hypothetical protein
MDMLTILSLFAVTAMLVFYALEDQSPWYIVAFAGACALGSAALVNRKHAENGSEELDNGAVQHRDRRNKPDNQGEDGQGIHVARLVCDKTPDSLNKHAAGLLTPPKCRLQN